MRLKISDLGITWSIPLLTRLILKLSRGPARVTSSSQTQESLPYSYWKGHNMNKERCSYQEIPRILGALCNRTGNKNQKCISGCTTHSRICIRRFHRRAYYSKWLPSEPVPGGSLWSSNSHSRPKQGSHLTHWCLSQWLTKYFLRDASLHPVQGPSQHTFEVSSPSFCSTYQPRISNCSIRGFFLSHWTINCLRSGLCVLCWLLYPRAYYAKADIAQ